MRFLAILLLLIIIAMSIYGVYHYYQSYKPALDKYSELVSENKTINASAAAEKISTNTT